MFKKKKDEPSGPPLPKGIKPEGGGEEHVIEVAAPSTKDTSNIKISSVLNHELEKISEATSLALYEELYARARHIYTADLKGEPDSIRKLNPLIEKVVDTLHAGNTEIVLACLKDYPSAEDFMYYHVVNVTISSMAMGLSMGYEKQRLMELGVAALVHDIGAK